MAYNIPTIPFSEWLALAEQDPKTPVRPDAFELDWWLVTDNPSFNDLVSRLADELETARPRKRHHRHLTLNLRALLASLFDAHDREPGRPTKYDRKPAAYSDPLEDRPEWVSCRLLISLVDGLADLGYVGELRGRNDDSGRPAMLSLVWPLGRLTGLFERYDLKRERFHYPVERLPVVLRAAKKDAGHGKRLRHVACIGAEADIVKAAEPVIRFNDFMASHVVALDRLPVGLADKRNVNLTRMSCHRVFNDIDPANPQLSLGGRLYGPGWQALSKDLRPYLLIDGNPTVELDYGSLHPRMLYHLAGLEVDEDPYEVPGLSRETAKTLVNRLINSTSYQIAAACRVPFDEIKANWNIELPDARNLRSAIDAIKERHRPVAGRFGRGEGLRLQNLDSEVCAAVLDWGVRSGVPALPVHDSFIVPAQHEEELRTVMVDAYRKVVGPFDPVIKRATRQDREPATANLPRERPNREPLRPLAQWETATTESPEMEEVWDDPKKWKSLMETTYSQSRWDDDEDYGRPREGRLRSGGELWEDIINNDYPAGESILLSSH